eukprot:TRINITY_DN7420_c0_g1_i1.p1 TRINITY_DN7420_c0_g1~~TRINITY_DN7420_c0_g1_i1.p1  ORF type:complete len:656 (-),score=111.76 TRINITY_DN7420_c0_g1_i1:206-2122(-)
MSKELQKSPDPEANGEQANDAVDEYVPNPTENPVSLSWDNLTYTVKIKGKDKQLVKNVSGSVSSGQLLAIMGPSGAGKTTMLNMLAYRLPPKAISGLVLVNGNEVDRLRYKRISGFVTQDDVMHPFLTVRETLHFAALLRLPSAMSYAQKRAKVALAVANLSLKKCYTTIIGNTIIRGVSGGEKKRVNIGREIISDPSILFLDEPTSGLDSFSSLGLVQLLSNMAHQDKRTIICTIHQPRADIFTLFDKLLLMANGEVIYFGPPKAAIGYFSSLGHPCPKRMNPADYFIDVITPDNRTPETAATKLVQINGLIKSWNQNKEYFQDFNEKGMKIDNTLRVVSEFNVMKGERFTDQSKLAPRPGVPAQMMYLIVRNLINQIRDKEFIAIRLGVAIFLGLIIGFLYFRIDEDNENIQNILGFLYFSTIFFTFVEMNVAINAIPAEREIYTHEVRAMTYTVSSYFFAKVIADIPNRLLLPTLYSNTAYWLVALRPTGFGFFYIVGVLYSFCASSFGFWVGVMCPNQEIAIALSSFVYIVNVIFGGFFVIVSSMPSFLFWINYLSFLKYGYEILVLNEFQDRDFGCDIATQSETGCRTGNDVISDLDFDDAKYDVNFPVIVIFTIAFLTLGYLTMRIQRLFII